MKLHLSGRHLSYIPFRMIWLLFIILSLTDTENVLVEIPYDEEIDRNKNWHSTLLFCAPSVSTSSSQVTYPSFESHLTLWGVFVFIPTDEWRCQDLRMYRIARNFQNFNWVVSNSRAASWSHRDSTMIFLRSSTRTCIHVMYNTFPVKCAKLPYHLNDCQRCHVCQQTVLSRSNPE